MPLITKNGFDSTQKELSEKTKVESIVDDANQMGGVNLSLSIGTSKSSSTSTQTSSTAQGSSVIAGGDISIKATGAGEQSDINIIGSTIKAGGDANLKADDEVNLIAAKNTDTLASKNKSSSASVGISIGSNGLAITASASQGKGKANGTDVTWTESVVQAGNKISLESGTDTNLIGAQVKGNQVVANVGTSGNGDLNIQSLQDTSTYDSKQKSTGISVSIPIGAGMAGGSFSSSNTKISSDYASVNEQAGIYAGDGGFQVSVNGNTDLKGAVIASNESAIANHKNNLSTDTLTVSNIENKAEYEGKGVSATVGGGIQAGLPQLSGAGMGSDKGKANTTTVSAISGGAIDIKDNTGQQAQSGTDAVTTIALLNRDVVIDDNGNAVDSQGNSTANAIAPIFDAEKVTKEIRAQVQITEAFGQQSGYVVEKYAEKQMDELRTRYAAETDPEKRKGMQAEVDRLRLETSILNVLIGAVTGSGSSALAHESLAYASEELRKITIENSRLSPPVVDDPGNGEQPFTLSNVSGISEGGKWDLEPTKTGGTRLDLDGICGQDNDQCVKNEDGSLKLNDKGGVQWSREKANNLSLEDWLKTPEGKDMRGLTGGIQAVKGTLFGVPYEAGSLIDKVIEAFGGPHDVIGGQAAGFYDELGNAPRGRSTPEKVANEIWTAVALAPATPFAMATLLPSEVWQAISILLKGAK